MPKFGLPIPSFGGASWKGFQPCPMDPAVGSSDSRHHTAVLSASEHTPASDKRQARDGHDGSRRMGIQAELDPPGRGRCAPGGPVKFGGGWVQQAHRSAGGFLLARNGWPCTAQHNSAIVATCQVVMMSRDVGRVLIRLAGNRVATASNVAVG